MPLAEPLAGLKVNVTSVPEGALAGEAVSAGKATTGRAGFEVGHPVMNAAAMV